MTPIQPADELRHAAKLMRDRAEAATPGPWEASGRVVDQAAGDYADVIGSEVECMAYCYGGTAVLPVKADAEYIASMHPAVALAVADWLDNEAAATELVAAEGPALGLPTRAAVALARAYLGGQIEALAEPTGTFTEQEG